MRSAADCSCGLPWPACVLALLACSAVLYLLAAHVLGLARFRGLGIEGLECVGVGCSVRANAAGCRCASGLATHSQDIFKYEHADASVLATAWQQSVHQSSQHQRLSFCRDAEATVETLARIALADRATWVHAVRQPLQVGKAACRAVRGAAIV